MRKTVVAVRHIQFEDLGTFGSVLTEAGYEIRYCDAGVDDVTAIDPVRPDLVVVLGAPIGVYEEEAYPFLATERRLLDVRLAADRPTFGICLGAQLMAAAMGARVFASGVKEIGFSAITLTDAGRQSALRHLAGLPVLHWHGDTFDLPAGTSHLAATALCRNQAFALGANVMAVQFHPEAETAAPLERWLIGHAAELAAAKIDPRSLRAEGLRAATALRDAARETFAEWLRGLRP